MRLASFQRAQQELEMPPLWRLEIGGYLLLGVTSSLIALPFFEPDTLPAERPEWHQLREQHLAEIRRDLRRLKTLPTSPVVLPRSHCAAIPVAGGKYPREDFPG